MSVRPIRRAGRRVGTATLLVVASVTLAACSGGSPLPGADRGDAADTSGAAAESGPVKVVTNVAKGDTDVPVDRLVEVTVEDGTLSSVRVTSPAGNVPGEMSGNGSSWTASDRLEPGATYTVQSVAEDSDGKPVRSRSSFTTQALTLDEQTYPSVAPLAGETVGVGMPVIVSFDVPVTDRSAFEENMTVTSTPKQPGTWHWINENEARWRPKSYWRAGTEVSVDLDINGVDAGNGIYGQEDRRIDFEVGDANVYKVDADTKQMEVYSNGELLRTIPVTTGKPGFTTRSGVKVIMEMFDSRRMNSETVGIPAGSSEAYNIAEVQWAMRVTNSGEFIHAAPWSVGSQGIANVSHGCTGLSPEDAGWLYSMSKRGDVVEYTGTDRPMEPDNGYGDWNIPYREYVRGSALS